MNNYVLYKAKSPSGRTYIGITNNFKRRMKEHSTSKYPFGEALRKYGKHNFTFEFEHFSSVEDALQREAELVTEEQVADKKYYNVCVGGTMSNVLINNNPMNNPESKQKMIASQKCKQVYIQGNTYYGIREAARQLGISRQLVVYRLKAKSFTDWYYV